MRQRPRLDDLNRTISGFSEDTERVSTHFLNAIQGTVDALTKAERKTEEHYKIAQSLLEAVITKANNTPQRPIDPEDEITQTLASALQRLDRDLAELREKRQSAVDDPQLAGDHEDSVLICYDRVIPRIENLAQALYDLRQAVLEHDANVDTRVSETFSDSDSLIRALDG